MEFVYIEKGFFGFDFPSGEKGPRFRFNYVVHYHEVDLLAHLREQDSTITSEQWVTRIFPTTGPSMDIPGRWVAKIDKFIAESY